MFMNCIATGSFHRLKTEHLFPSKTSEPCVTAVCGRNGCGMTLNTLSEKTKDRSRKDLTVLRECSCVASSAAVCVS